MALYWNVSKCDPKKVWNDDKRMHHIAEAIIYSSLAIDLGAVTEKNIDEWFVRLTMLNEIGLSCRPDNKKWSRADIERCIGLTTNVISTTRAAFVKKVGKIMESRAKDALRREALLKGGA
jgi:hypothetical protein